MRFKTGLLGSGGGGNEAAGVSVKHANGYARRTAAFKMMFSPAQSLGRGRRVENSFAS